MTCWRPHGVRVWPPTIQISIHKQVRIGAVLALSHSSAILDIRRQIFRCGSRFNASEKSLQMVGNDLVQHRAARVSRLIGRADHIQASTQRTASGIMRVTYTTHLYTVIDKSALRPVGRVPPRWG